MTRSALAVALLALAACTREAPLVRLDVEPTARGAMLTLRPAAGARINARLQPALELADGAVLRFDSPRLTPDSAYFAAPPTALLPNNGARSGVLRASVCPRGESICRTVVRAVRL